MSRGAAREFNQKSIFLSIMILTSICWKQDIWDIHDQTYMTFCMVLGSEVPAYILLSYVGFKKKKHICFILKMYCSGTKCVRTCEDCTWCVPEWWKRNFLYWFLYEGDSKLLNLERVPRLKRGWTTLPCVVLVIEWSILYHGLLKLFFSSIYTALNNFFWCNSDILFERTRIRVW